MKYLKKCIFWGMYSAFIKIIFLVRVWIRNEYGREFGFRESFSNFPPKFYILLFFYGNNFILYVFLNDPFYGGFQIRKHSVSLSILSQLLYCNVFHYCSNHFCLFLMFCTFVSAFLLISHLDVYWVVLSFYDPCLT